MTAITVKATFDGSSFQCNIDYQKELYYWVGLKPAEYQLEVDGNITIVEIDLPSPDCKFRLETGKNNYCWAGLESSNSRYLKRYPLFL